MSIKRPRSFRVMLGLLATAGLVACASPDGDHGRHHADQSAETAGNGLPGGPRSTGGMMAAGMTGSNGSCPMTDCGNAAASTQRQPMMDKDAMCAMYRGMRDAPTEQARQAMMERNMQAMSPEMRRQHMEMMRQQCQ